MKTTLPLEITSIAEARAFLSALNANGEAYHPDDNAHSIYWNMPVSQQPVYAEADRLNKLMADIFKLEGFDPYQYLLDCDFEIEIDAHQGTTERMSLSAFIAANEVHELEFTPADYDKVRELDYNDETELMYDLGQGVKVTRIG